MHLLPLNHLHLTMVTIQPTALVKCLLCKCTHSFEALCWLLSLEKWRGSRFWPPTFSGNSRWFGAREEKGVPELTCIRYWWGPLRGELLHYLGKSPDSSAMPRTAHTKVGWERILCSTLTSSRYSMSAVQYPSFIPLFKTLNRFPPTVSTTDLPSGRKCTFLICNIQP